MRQIEKCLIGDLVRLNNYTADWYSAKLHPVTYFRRLDQFDEGFKRVKGLFAEIDLGQYVLIRFSNKDDLTEFHRLHHTYI